jgi:hypothetical protein
MFKVTKITDGVETILHENGDYNKAVAKFNLAMLERTKEDAIIVMYFNTQRIKMYTLRLDVKGNRYSINDNESGFSPVWTLTQIYDILKPSGLKIGKTSLNNYMNDYLIEGLDYLKSEKIYMVFESGLKKMYEKYIKDK